MNCSFIIVHTVCQPPVCALLISSHSAAVVITQHNRLTTVIYMVSVDARLFHFEFLKCIHESGCVKMWGCVSIERVREWQRSSSPVPVFLSTAVGRAIFTDSGWEVAGSGGLRELLAKTESGSFSLWQREVTGRQCTGDRRTASQRHLHSFRTAAYPCTKKHAHLKRPPSTLPHSALHMHTGWHRKPRKPRKHQFQPFTLTLHTANKVTYNL